MARYRLDIHLPAPWTAFPATVAQYNGMRRARGDAALYMMRRAIYEAMRANSLLDRPVARDLMTKAENSTAPRHGYYLNVSAGGWSFCLYREA